jgi:DNA end-binding protein Ku
MTSEWDPGRYYDEYREAVMDWIEKKARLQGAMPPPEGAVEEKEPGKVVDMMELLKKNVNMASNRRRKEKAHEKTEDAA